MPRIFEHPFHRPTPSYTLASGQLVEGEEIRPGTYSLSLEFVENAPMFDLGMNTFVRMEDAKRAAL